MIARPHDLVRIAPECARRWNAPNWVHAALECTPWVVVRRAAVPRGIAVGVRGRGRSERFAAAIFGSDVLALCTPADLVARIGDTGERLERAARFVERAAHRSGLEWGPAGAYGFELATGMHVTHPSSDLDAIVAAAPAEALIAFASACAAIASSTGVRLDVEVQCAHGGVALDEYVAGADRVLAKTSGGPALVSLRA
ncbi:MAG: malonate decarboxylase holo-ACP synthase [Candidatus Velthaea sp.]